MPQKVDEKDAGCMADEPTATEAAGFLLTAKLNLAFLSDSPRSLFIILKVSLLSLFSDFFCDFSIDFGTLYLGSC